MLKRKNRSICKKNWISTTETAQDAYRTLYPDDAEHAEGGQSAGIEFDRERLGRVLGYIERASTQKNKSIENNPKLASATQPIRQHSKNNLNTKRKKQDELNDVQVIERPARRGIPA